jgi:hypothetical protein
MVMILGSLATITDQVNKLVELLSITSPYARASYKAKSHPHVMICGSMNIATKSHPHVMICGSMNKSFFTLTMENRRQKLLLWAMMSLRWSLRHCLHHQTGLEVGVS